MEIVCTDVEQPEEIEMASTPTLCGWYVPQLSLSAQAITVITDAHTIAPNAVNPEECYGSRLHMCEMANVAYHSLGIMSSPPTVTVTKAQQPHSPLYYVTPQIGET